MSRRNDEQYCWRETYFVWFDSARRPQLEKTTAAMRALGHHFELSDAVANDKGQFESLTIRSPEDHAALEIDYLAGDEVRDAGATLAAELRPGEDVDSAKLARLIACDARFDVMHFERLFDPAEDGDPDEEADELFDPSALVTVLEALIRLTGGVGVDPQSGMLL